MKTIALVSCVKTKRLRALPARELFAKSTLFRLSYAYARSLQPDKILLLTTEYGLVEPEEVIDSYDRSPNHMVVYEWKEWAHRVTRRLSNITDIQNDRFIFVTGAKYSAALIPYITHYELPLSGLTQGRRLHFLKARKGLPS